MTRTTRCFLLPALMAAGVCLTPTRSNEAVAQITFSVPGVSRSYYNGYSTPYRPGSRQLGYSRRAYSGYGNGPYGYGSAVPYGYPSSAYPSSAYPFASGYRFRTGQSYSSFYGGAYLRSGSYRPVYRPPTTRYYSPYGYRGY